MFDLDDMFPLVANNPQPIETKPDNPTLFDIAIEEFERLKRICNLPEWKLDLIKSKRFLGRTWHSRKVIELNIQLITIEKKDTEFQLLDTIRHEFAHAAVGRIVDSHGIAWKRKAVQLGAIPRPCANFGLIGKYKFTCPKCGFTAYRNHKPRVGYIYSHCGIASTWVATNYKG